MPFGLQLVTGPTSLVLVTLDEAKAHLLVNVDDADTDLTAKIAEAVRDAEGESGRAFLTQTWTLTLDRFPAGNRPIRLPLPPCQSVTWVKYYDTAGAQQTLSSGAYHVAAAGEPARIVPINGNAWPGTDLTRPEAVEVKFVAGYGSTQASVPADLRAAVLWILGHKWRHRGDDVAAADPVGSAAMPAGARRVLTNYRAPDCLAGGCDDG